MRVIAANHLFISNGLGLIAIPSEKTDEYKKLLVAYYEGKDETNIVRFLKEWCVCDTGGRSIVSFCSCDNHDRDADDS